MLSSDPKLKDRWDVVYTRCFKNQPEGYAVYQQLSTKQMKPGMCGYFDTYGGWNSIADLTAENELTWLGLKEESQIAGVQNWKFRKSDGVQEVSSMLEAGGGHAGVDGGIAIAYESTTSEEAILLTEGRVKHMQVSPNSKMIEWMNANAEHILSQHPDAKENGLWVISKTYSAPKRRFTILKSKGTKIPLSVNAQAFHQAKIQATHSWWATQHDEVWTEHADPDGVVLAFDGIHWTREWYEWSRKPKTKRRAAYLSGDGEDHAVLYPIPVPSLDEPGQSRLVLVPEIAGISISNVDLASSDDDDDEEEDGSDNISD